MSQPNTGPQPNALQRRVAWLLRFADTDLAGRRRDDPRLRKNAWRAVDPTCARPLQWGELREVHKHLREGLNQLRAGQPWRLEITGEHVLVPGPRGLDGPLDGRFEARWPWHRFLISAMDLLVAVGDRLRACRGAGCERVFVAVRRQQFCSECAKALQKERVRDWRRRNPQRLRDLAHEAYVRRKRRETGRPNLKIGRRPRQGKDNDR